jgi:HTH-type transcriptional regulator / antitoxin HigA
MSQRQTYDDRDTYLLLVEEFPLRPIRSDQELAQATEMTDRLSMRDDLEPGEEDYLDVLDGLVSQYEREHYPVRPLEDGPFLKELIEARRLTQREVARATGIVYSTISSVVAGRRVLTRPQVAALARYFRVPPASFVMPQSGGRSDEPREF